MSLLPADVVARLGGADDDAVLGGGARHQWWPDSMAPGVGYAVDDDDGEHRRSDRLVAGCGTDANDVDERYEEDDDPRRVISDVRDLDSKAVA